jgi:hypothetical protein
MRENRSFLFGVLVTLFATYLYGVDAPPIPPVIDTTIDETPDTDENLTVDTNTTVDENSSVELPPETPTVDENESVEFPPETPTVDENESVEFPPETPTVDENESVEFPPETPTVEIEVEFPPETPTVDENESVEFPPKTPNIDENDSVEFPPETPNIDGNGSVEFPPKTPDIDTGAGDIDLPPQTPTDQESNTTTNLPPDIPDIDTGAGDIDLPPQTPTTGETGADGNNPPETPDIGDTEVDVNNPPETPDIGDTEVDVNNPPEAPDVDDTKVDVNNPPETPDVGNVEFTVITSPEVPEIAEFSQFYIDGEILLPESDGGTLQLIFTNLAKTEFSADIDRDESVWFIKLPKDGKRYIVSLLYTDENGIETTMFVDTTDFSLRLWSGVDYIKDSESGQYIPDIGLFTSTSDRSSAGSIDWKTFKDSLETVSGAVFGAESREFQFEAVDKESGGVYILREAQISGSNFGFKLPKDREYFLILNLLDSGENLYLTYEENSSTNTILYSSIELKFDGDTPILEQYFDLSTTLQLSSDLNDYYDSQFYISGGVVWSGDKNITLSLMRGDGSFLNEETLEKSSNYQFNIRIGRDALGEELFLILYIDGEENSFAFDGESGELKILRDIDWVENGLDREKFSPLVLSSNSQTVSLDVNSVQIYKLIGNLEIPAQLDEEEIYLLFTDSEDKEYFVYPDSEGNYSIEFDGEITLEKQEVIIEGLSFSLRDLNDTNSLFFGDGNRTLSLSGSDTLLTLDMNISKIWKQRNYISGDITVPTDISDLQIFAIGKDGTNLGVTKIDSSGDYLLPLDIFGVSGEYIIFQIEYIKGGEAFSYLFNGSELLSSEEVEWSENSSGEWEINFSTLQLSTTIFTKTFNLNVSNLISEVENRQVKFNVTVLSNETATLSVEILNTSGEIVGTLYLEDSDGNDSLQVKISNYGDYIFSIYQTTADGEYRGWFYNPTEEKLIDYLSVDYRQVGELLVPDSTQTGVFQTNISNREFYLDLNLTSAVESMALLSGTISNIGAGELEIFAYALDGKTLLGSGVVDGSGNYKIEIPESYVGKEIVLKVVDSSTGESYFLGSNPVMVSGDDVDTAFDINWSAFGITTIVVEDNISRSIGDWTSFVDGFNSIQYSVSGTLSESAKVSVIDTSSGEIFKTSGDSKYSIYLSAGSYIIFIEVDGKKLFYNPSTEKYILSSTVDWVEISSGVWIPDSGDTGFFSLSSTEKQKVIDLYFPNISNSIREISGEILLSPSLILGDGRVLESEIFGESGSKVGGFQIDEVGEYINGDIRYEFSANINIDTSDSWSFAIEIYDNSNSDIVEKVVTDLDSISIDLTDLGENKKSLSGDITTPSDFDDTNSESRITISLFDALTGDFFDSTKLVSDGNYSLSLGDTGGNFFIIISLKDGDLTREFYLDFSDSTDKSSFTVKRSDEISFKESNGNWIPDIGFVTLLKNSNLSISITDTLGSTISGAVTLPEGATNGEVHFKDYSTGVDYFADLESGIFQISDVRGGDYSVDIEFERNSSIHSFFITSSSPISADEVIWTFQKPRYIPSNVRSYGVSSDTSFSFNLSTVLDNKESFSLFASISDANFSSAELFVPNSSIYYKISGDGDKNLSVSGLASRDDYYLLFKIGKRDYFFNNTDQLETDVEWYAFNSSGTRVCPTISMSWNCSWSEADEWIWRPQVDTINITSDVNLSLTMPLESRVTGTIKLGSSFGEVDSKISLYQWNGDMDSDYSYKTDTSGDIPFSIVTSLTDNYRFELKVSNFSYAVSQEQSIFSLISKENSWSGVSPKEETLLDLSSDLDLGDIELEQLNLLTISLENLEDGETILFKLKNSDGDSFEDDNLLQIGGETGYESTLSILVPDGSYTATIYPSQHSSGFVTDSSDTGTYSQFSWSETPLQISITGDRSMVISLLSNSDLKTISGKVDIESGDVESGWIEIGNDLTTRGAVVEDDGTFSIEGVEPASDYTITYFSWDFDGLQFSKSVGPWYGDDYTNFSISKPTDTYRVYGTISGGENLKAVLIKLAGTGDWSVMDISSLDENSEYLFENIPSSSDIYLVGAGIKAVTESGGSTYRVFGATDGDSLYYPAVGDENSSITVTFDKQLE